MLGRDEHDDLVAQLYAAALGETPWTATLQQLAETFGSSAAILQVSNPGPEPLHVVNYGYSTEFQARYFASEAYFNDPRPSYFYKVPAGAVYFDSALYDVDEMYRNPSVRETCDILKVQYQLGAVMALPHGTRAWLTLLMTPKEGHPSEAAIQAYRRLAPHMEQACALGHLLEHKGAVQSAVLEGMATKADGVILLGLDGVPSFMNDAAHAIIARGDGLSFSSTGFAARRGPETRRLQQLIGQAIAASRQSDLRPGGQMLVTRSSGLKPYVLRIMPAPPGEQLLVGAAAGCVMHIHDLAAVDPPSKGTLAAVFGLSEREADLAVELVRCASLADAARAAGMAVNTARNHLQSIFRKSGARSQADAVQLLGRLR